MYACICETRCGVFQAVCTPSNVCANSCDPPPPPYTKEPEPHCQDSGPKRITPRATVGGVLA
jgi:hypothetical protein